VSTIKIAAIASLSTLLLVSGTVSPCPFSSHATSKPVHDFNLGRSAPKPEAEMPVTSPEDGYKPIGKATIDGKPFLVFASQDGSKHDEQAAEGHGLVDVFDSRGRLIRRFAALERADSHWETFEYIPVANSGSH
jgi:hypothetical protein